MKPLHSCAHCGFLSTALAAFIRGSDGMLLCQWCASLLARAEEVERNG